MGIFNIGAITLATVISFVAGMIVGSVSVLRARIEIMERNADESEAD